MKVFRTILGTLVTPLFLVIASQATANIEQVFPIAGDLAEWGVVTLGQSSAADKLATTSSINGDVAVGGNGDVSIGFIAGDLYCPSNGNLKLTAGATVTGNIFDDQDSVINNAVNEAMALAQAAANLQTTNFLPDVNLKTGQTFTLSGGPGETVVLNLKSFRMATSTTFTLQGTATTTFVINVQKQFSLSGTSKILLSGGVAWDDVLFNVRGTGSVKITDLAQFQGILLATKRTVKLSRNASVTGSVIADRLAMSGSATVTHPPVTSP